MTGGTGGETEVDENGDPVSFGSGVPVFTGQTETDPLEVFLTRGFKLTEQRDLNATGTRYYQLAPM